VTAAAIAAGLALKERLPRAWPAFFERHGAFTAAQLAAIPPLLDGADTILCAGTAGGKTEAAVAPLIERHCRPNTRGVRPGARAAGPHGPSILYVVPTRALVGDLAARLEHPLDVLGLRLAVRTGDANTLRPSRPPALLLTTPESLDFLLATRPALFAPLRAVVLDELHLLDGTPRGDQLRVLLRRLRRIRAYAYAHGGAPDATLQHVALSATLADPTVTAARYFPGDHTRVVQVPGGRAMEAELFALALGSIDELMAYLGTFRQRGWRKALVFCSTRAEVEAYGAAVRGRSPFGANVYVHYSNIEAARRHEIERSFAEMTAAILFATSTLELGIDIGNVDVVIQIGPPGHTDSFVQRMGRGNRRRSVTRVACFYRSPLERLLFTALCAHAEEALTPRPPLPCAGEGEQDSNTFLAAGATLTPRPPFPCAGEGGQDGAERERDGILLSPMPRDSLLATTAIGHNVLPSPAHGRGGRGEGPGGEGPGGEGFRPAVAVQQIFSLLQASPTGALRLPELAALFEGLLASADLEDILARLRGLGYLADGRPGEWRPGDRLNRLLDQQGSPRCSVSLYGNIQNDAGRTISIRDQHSGQTVATVDAWWLEREVLTLEGRPVSVEWYDGEAMWVTPSGGNEPAPRLSYRSERRLLSYELARLLPAQLGLAAGVAPLVELAGDWSSAGNWEEDGGYLLFHWLGDLYGRALRDLLRYTVPAGKTTQPGLAVRVPDSGIAIPAWTADRVERYLRERYRDLESSLNLGPFQHLLPLELRRHAVVEAFDVARFLAATEALRPVRAPESVAEDLSRLLADGSDILGVTMESGAGEAQ